MFFGSNWEYSFNFCWNPKTNPVYYKCYLYVYLCLLKLEYMIGRKVNPIQPKIMTSAQSTGCRPNFILHTAFTYYVFVTDLKKKTPYATCDWYIFYILCFQC